MTDGVIMDSKSEKLKNIIKSQYPSIRSFADAVGIPYTTLVTALKNGIGGMAVEKVILICEKLNIDIQTFDSISTKDTDSFPILPVEKELIKKYRALDERGKKSVYETLERELKYATETQEQSENKAG